MLGFIALLLVYRLVGEVIQRAAGRLIRGGVPDGLKATARGFAIGVAAHDVDTVRFKCMRWPAPSPAWGRD